MHFRTSRYVSMLDFFKNPFVARASNRAHESLRFPRVGSRKGRLKVQNRFIVNN